MSTWSIASQAIPPGAKLVPSLAWGMAGVGSAIGLLATSAWLITRAAEAPPILYLTFAVVGVRAFALGRAVFRYFERVSSHSVAFHALEGLRLWMFDRLSPLAPAGIRGVKRGGLLRALVADVDTLQDLPLRIVAPVGSALVVVAVSVGAIASVTPLGALVLAGIIVAALVTSVAITRAVGRASDRDIAPGRARYADDVMDLIVRRRVLEAFGAADSADEQARMSAHQVERAETRHALSVGATPGLMMVFTGLAIGAMAVVGLPLVESVSAPVFAVLVLVPLAIFESLAVVPAAVSAWRLITASAGRIEELLPAARPREIPQESADVPRAVLGEPSLTLRNVQARWPGASAPALEPITVSLRAGDKVAVSGVSGSGKSTLTYLLVRFLDHTGEYTLCGVDARLLPVDQVRETVALCEQRPHLFSTSIRHNLSFAKPDATDDEFLQVLERVGLSSWVAERGGLDASVGERGVLVSGGQAQRIALARALLSDAPIIIFDEPTANVEQALSDHLMRDLLQAGGDQAERIVIVMTHTRVPEDLITQSLRLRVP
jgi:ATP-binding cassette, subfamily C, bacterial CydC